MRNPKQTMACLINRPQFAGEAPARPEKRSIVGRTQYLRKEARHKTIHLPGCSLIEEGREIPKEVLMSAHKKILTVETGVDVLSNVSEDKRIESCLQLLRLQTSRYLYRGGGGNLAFCVGPSPPHPTTTLSVVQPVKLSKLFPINCRDQTPQEPP